MELLATVDNSENSEIAQWYSGRSILITGATGFMGKVLVEKLLRSCSGIKRIYLLIRSKRGVDPLARKDHFLKCVGIFNYPGFIDIRFKKLMNASDFAQVLLTFLSQIFAKVLKENPDIVQKIHIVKGDVLDDGLGLSPIDRNELISNVEVIFHCAANVRFDQPLRPMIQINVAGTLKVLELAEKMPGLKVIVHVSTSYCQCNESVLEERAYPAPQNPYDIIKMVEEINDDILKEITPRLLDGIPNTYAYSKALAEDLICKYGKELPIIITRPTIVTAAMKEPLPGWIEGINGPTGLMIGAARGVIRTMHCNPEYSSSVIPVDKAINGMLVAGYKHGKSNEKSSIEFCNICLSKKALLSWRESIETGKRFFHEFPLSFVLWYPDGAIKKSYIHHLFCVIFFHYLPAYLIDFFLLIFGRKTFMVHIQNKISAGLKLLQYYTTKDWDFRNENFQRLSDNLSQTDLELFDISVNQLNWEQYIRGYVIGMRTYIIGESEDTIPKARRILRRFYILDRVTTYTFFVLVFWFLWAYLDSFVEQSDAIIKFSLKILYRDYNKTVHI